MKTKKTLLIIGIFLFLGITFSVKAQEKYGNELQYNKVSFENSDK